MQFQEQIEIMFYYLQVLIGTTQPFPATNSTRGVTYPLADNAILTATEVALVNSYRCLQRKIKGYCQLRLVRC
jgi:hypothetical protein